MGHIYSALSIQFYSYYYRKHLKWMEDVVIEEALYEQIGRGGSGIVLKKTIKKPLL